MEYLQQLHHSTAMNLCSYSFVLVFLPLSLFLYYIVPARGRVYALLLCSLGYIALDRPSALAPMLVILLWDYLILRMMSRPDFGQRARFFLAGFCAAKNVLLAVLSMLVPGLGILGAGFGVPVYALISTGCVVAACRGTIPCEKNPARYVAFCGFYPLQFAGPVIDYGVFSRQLERAVFSPANLVDGACMFMIGVGKYRILGSGMYEVFRATQRLGTAANPIASWLLVLALFMTLCFTFGGLCDMARGIARMLGLRVPENFDYPLQSAGMADFLRRFLSSVSAALARLLPIAGKKGGSALLMLLGGLCVGFFAGREGMFVLWGGLVGLVAALFALIPFAVSERLPEPLERLLSILLILIFLALPAAGGVRAALTLVATMFTPGGGGYDQVLYVLATNWVLLAAGLFFSTSTARALGRLLRRLMPWIARPLSLLSGAAAFALYIILNAH